MLTEACPRRLASRAPFRLPRLPLFVSWTRKWTATYLTRPSRQNYFASGFEFRFRTQFVSRLTALSPKPFRFFPFLGTRPSCRLPLSFGSLINSFPLAAVSAFRRLHRAGTPGFRHDARLPLQSARQRPAHPDLHPHQPDSGGRHVADCGRCIRRGRSFGSARK
jgi:hypothetical protein